MASRTISVVLCVEDVLVQEGLLGLLRGKPDVTVDSCCASATELLATVAADDPQVVVFESRLWSSDVADRLVGRPGLGIVVLGRERDGELPLRLLRHGVSRRAFVQRGDQITGAIRTVADGGSLIPPEIVEAAIAARDEDAADPLRDLTPRERQVLGRMAAGRSNRAIADELGLSENSVQKYITNIFAKLGVTWEDGVDRRVRAVLIFLDHGLRHIRTAHPGLACTLATVAERATSLAADVSKLS